MQQAINDTNAAADRAFGSAESRMDNLSTRMGNAADSAQNRSADALHDVANDIAD